MPDIPFEIRWENQEPQDDIEEDRQTELCEDENCTTCYPHDSDSDDSIPTRFEQLATNIHEWTFTTNSNTSIPIDFVGQDALSGADMLESIEGEDVPVNPEVVRPTPVLIDPDIFFHDRSGTRVLNTGAVNAGYVCQIQVWNMTPDRVREAFTKLKEWLVENQFGVSQYSNEYMYEGDNSANIPYYFTLCEVGNPRYVDPAELFSQPDCSCGEEMQYPTLICHNDHEEHQYCSSCREFSTGVVLDEVNGHMCANCGRTCDECDNIFHSSHLRCPECNPSIRCHGCHETIFLNDTDGFHELERDGRSTLSYCTQCYSGLCHSCNQVVGEDNILVDEGNSCVSCVSRNSSEEWDENSELENERLSIPSIPGREVIRLVGVEIEGANGDEFIENQGGNILAEALYNNGLSRGYQMGGYHSSSRSLVHVERDSSVDWEMVVGPLNFAEPSHVDTLNRSVKVVRGFINDKTLKLDMRAGLHIHVGADRVPFHNAYNLHKLYMYMEDFLYRFGAAKWPYHRSINRRGRDQAGKSPNTEGKLHFARTFSGQRYYGLSFDNYFARYFEQCGCGARTYGLFDECTCDLGKCTFEFRLFNTTANTVKLHAYLAMCQALVAKAIGMDEIKNVSEYPPLDFVKSRVSDMHSSTRRKMNREWEKRIVFVNEQLPLTPDEKVSIHYCIMNSEMGKTVTNADILLETEDN